LAQAQTGPLAFRWNILNYQFKLRRSRQDAIKSWTRNEHGGTEVNDDSGGQSNSAPVDERDK
jgi:hypothetical protein